MLRCMTLLLLATASSLASAAAPEAVYPLRPYRKTIALEASLNGSKGFFTFDTAGGITLVSPAMARKIGCTPWGRLSGHRMMGDRLDTPRCDNLTLQLGAQHYALPTTAVLDATRFLAKDAAPVDGSIALDAFAGKAITIDFPAWKLIVESPGSLRQRVGELQPLPLSLSRELQGRALAASIGVPSTRGMLWMELDSGNGGTLLVSKPYAELLGLDPTAEGPQKADFAISPMLRARGDAFTPDMLPDGNLGMPFLKDKVVTLDLANGRLWIVSAATKPPAGD